MQVISLAGSLWKEDFFLFLLLIYITFAGVNAMANVDELVVQLAARDPDLGVNGSIVYYIAASNLYK